MIRPNYLKKGAAIAIVSTARKITTEELQPFLKLIKNWGLKAVLGATINAEDHQYAGDDVLRTKDFQEALNNPEIKAIWCARGGYGTVRIIDDLDFSEFIKNPKWIIGYSDVTVLHSHIHNLGVETLHANMAMEMDLKTAATRKTPFEVLFGNNYQVKYSSNHSFNRKGTASGTLVGGNLSILYSLIGSPSHIDTDGKILFIEDLDEMLYHVDRMMQNLKRSGMLSNIKGLIVAGMNDMNDNTIPFGKSAEEIISELVSAYNFPLCFGFPAGHINDNQALILGREVQFEVTEKEVTLRFNK